MDVSRLVRSQWTKHCVYTFCPRRTIFVGGLCDGPDRVVCRLSVCLFKTLSYFWNQTSEFDETLLVLFIGQ